MWMQSQGNPKLALSRYAFDTIYFLLRNRIFILYGDLPREGTCGGYKQLSWIIDTGYKSINFDCFGCISSQWSSGASGAFKV